MAILPNPNDNDTLVAVHRGVEDDGRPVWDVTLDGPEGTRAVLHTTHDETEAARLAVGERERRSAAQLRWLVSWDGLMHAFTREQAAAEFAVMALCGHIAQTSTVKKGETRQCYGCLVALGQSLPGPTWQ